MKHEYDRKPVAVDTVFVESNGRLVIEDVTGNVTAFGRKELVLVAK